MRFYSVMLCGLFAVLGAGMCGCVVDRTSLSNGGEVSAGGVGGDSDEAMMADWENAFSGLQESGEFEEPGPLVLIEAERVYRVVDSGGEVATIRVEQVDDAEYPYRRYTADNRIEHLRLGGDASVLIGRVEDLGHNQTTTYDPPVPLLPGAIRVGEPLVVESSMVVRPSGNPDAVTTRGTCVVTISLVGVERVNVGGESLEAHRILTAYEAKMGMASVTQSTTSWWVTGWGLAAEQSAERIGALIFNSTTERKMIAAE